MQCSTYLFEVIMCFIPPFSQFPDFEDLHYLKRPGQEHRIRYFPNHTSTLVWWMIMILLNNVLPDR